MRGVIVTGGAKRIGAEIVKSLAEEGWNVILHYFSSETEAQKIAEYSKSHSVKGNITTFKADLNDEKQCKELIEFSFEQCDNVFGLVNNASHFKYNDFSSVDKESLIYDYNTNTIAR